MFEISNSILEDFHKFVETVCHWVKIKILLLAGGYTYADDDKDTFGKGNVVLSDLAINVIRQWGEIFCGFGAYSVQEIVFRAGLYTSECTIQLRAENV